MRFKLIKIMSVCIIVFLTGIAVAQGYMDNLKKAKQDYSNKMASIQATLAVAIKKAESDVAQLNKDLVDAYNITINQEKDVDKKVILEEERDGYTNDWSPPKGLQGQLLNNKNGEYITKCLYLGPFSNQEVSTGEDDIFSYIRHPDMIKKVYNRSISRIDAVASKDKNTMLFKGNPPDHYSYYIFYLNSKNETKIKINGGVFSSKLTVFHNFSVVSSSGLIKINKGNNIFILKISSGGNGVYFNIAGKGLIFGY